MPLCPVHEDGDCQQIVADRPLAVGEDGLRRYRELIPARTAFPELACCDRGDAAVATFRAVRLPAIIRPADFHELGVRLLVRHARNRCQRERPGGCRKEKILGHLPYSQVILRIR